MLVLGIISLVIAGISCLFGLAQDVVFQQYAYFLVGLILGVAGMGFLILDKLNIIAKKISEATIYSKEAAIYSKKETEPSNTEKLLQLNNLHKQGLLTDEEFASKKESLLKNIFKE
ncbi:SHOCT domain-containing protein [Candidatus Proelusimicrobium excrementi]|uniref:SHOCT domain-containing protein n=1 Tax=Candidatus Proelusimicrobium excrementi TaxID=3416222 RepID=UPI003C95D5D5|nr:SHOCT domain-containing protein [Elusimicrobiaceae bacterium]